MPYARNPIVDGMTLHMECTAEPLSEAQLAAYQRAADEHRRIRTKLDALVGDARCENVFLGEVFGAYLLPTSADASPPAELAEIARPADHMAVHIRRIKPPVTVSPPAKRTTGKQVRFAILDDDKNDVDYEPPPFATYGRKNASPPGGSPATRVKRQPPPEPSAADARSQSVRTTKRRQSTPAKIVTNGSVTSTPSRPAAVAQRSVTSTPSRSATPSRPAAVANRSATPSRPAAVANRPATPSRPAAVANRSVTSTPNRSVTSTPNRSVTSTPNRSVTSTPSRPTNSSSQLPASISIKLAGASASVRISEHQVTGGLAIGRRLQSNEALAASNAPSDTVDLTDDADEDPAGGTSAFDVSFGSNEHKTYPSLVVVARTHLNRPTNPAVAARSTAELDLIMRTLATYTPLKYCQWLFQRDLVRSEHKCPVHSVPLKLAIYSDRKRFPHTGGCVWMGTCCPAYFVSVFRGSLFEGSLCSPRVLLKLLYYWTVQSKVSCVAQWLKVDLLYVKNMYTLFRSVCTVALQQHGGRLGGPNRRVEVGIISLGSASSRGQGRQVKIEVLGVLDEDGRTVRLRAVKPLDEPDRLPKKRFQNLLGPLCDLVHPDSVIMTDLAVDRETLLALGFANVQQPADQRTRRCNTRIMDYLRTVVPKMFESTLLLLSHEMIQQFLDELVWREWYGMTAAGAFDNFVRHLAELTNCASTELLALRLGQVARNPFASWTHMSAKLPGDAPSGQARVSTTDAAVVKRGRRSAPAPVESPVPVKRVKDERKVRSASSGNGTPPGDVQRAASAGKGPAEQPDGFVYLETYFYAVTGPDRSGKSKSETKSPVRTVTGFQVQCPECHCTETDAVALMDHMKRHAVTQCDGPQSLQCTYCLRCSESDQEHAEHMATHPQQTICERARSWRGYACLICEQSFTQSVRLQQHMDKTHVQFEMPFRCGGCPFAASSLRHTVDHFYAEHRASGALQCPFCLQLFVVFGTGDAGTADHVLPVNVHAYVRHLREHVRLAAAGGHRCNRCCLRFLDEGALVAHQARDHAPMKRAGLLPMCRKTVRMPSPTVRSHKTAVMVKFVTRPKPITLSVPYGHMCLECDSDLLEPHHFPGLMECVCGPTGLTFRTACHRTMLTHLRQCRKSKPTRIGSLTPDDRLPGPYHCVCGYASRCGNTLAEHMLECGSGQTAYPSAQDAVANTVQRSMLGELGLVRRDSVAQAIPAAPPDSATETDSAPECLESDWVIGLEIEPVDEPMAE